MKNVYVILAFHAHELLWDLPKKILNSIEKDNPMKNTYLDENYLKKRKEEGRDIYSRCSQLGDTLNAPLCVEYTNELLMQIKEIMPESFQKLKNDYARRRLYPIYGHAHHTHVSLLQNEEITQEILWNKEYLHNYMGIPYPRYSGLFSPEASYSIDKLEGIEKANIDYVIFPHLAEEKVPFIMQGEGDYRYKPFLIKTKNQNLLALPRNFPISQEIWRPITKMKREEVKSQGYMLGDFPVFDSEYLEGKAEKFPIDFAEGVELYKKVIKKELENCPEEGLLIYIQDLELMDFGDIALEIIEKAWLDLIREYRGSINIHFITPDVYISKILKNEDIAKLPTLHFNQISWAPEIRLILRADGHYPPLGVRGIKEYDIQKTGLYQHPHIFWENGKYYCGIFDRLIKNFHISLYIPVSSTYLQDSGYDLPKENLETQAVFYLRIMKRACNWGWRPTEGRQKLPFLNGYKLCQVLLEKLNKYPTSLVLKRFPEKIDLRNIVGLVETLKVFLDNRIAYLKYGFDLFTVEKGLVLPDDYLQEIEEVTKWKDKAIKNCLGLYELYKATLPPQEEIKKTLELMQSYSQAVFMATDYLQRIWAKAPDTEYLVGKMYHYLYQQYPPAMPAMIDKIDNMNLDQIEEYFNTLKSKMLATTI